MKRAFLIQDWCITVILLIGTAVFVAISWSHPHIAEGKHARTEPVVIQPLSPPSGFTAADSNDDTAFPEEKAGISAYFRLKAPEQGSSEPRLNVTTVIDGLKSAPEESAIRGAGTVDDWGLNFGVVHLPMYAAVIPEAPVEKVTVYFDDQGWVVAYLPKDRPAAAIWKHGSAEGASVDDPEANADLGRNLVVLALNEVLKANNPNANEVGHSEVAYYDWANEDCDALALFSATARGGKSDPVKFVVPRTITEIQASAAVVITEQVGQGGSAVASVSVDGEIAVSTRDGSQREAGTVQLNRNSDETSLHIVIVDVGADNAAAGAVMLVYDKP